MAENKNLYLSFFSSGIQNYIEPFDENQLHRFQQRCGAVTDDLDDDLETVAEDLITTYRLPTPDEIGEFSQAVDLFKVLSEAIQKLVL